MSARITFLRRSTYVVLGLAMTGTALLAAGLTACSSGTPGADTAAAGPVRVVAGFYPLAYVVERVGGDRVNITNLTPPGAEPHDLELSPNQMDRIDSAAVAVVLGRGFQPSAEKAAANRAGATVIALDVILGESTDRNVDPHVWLDPTLLPPLVDAVAGALIDTDSSSKSLYESNAAALKSDLAALDARFVAGLTTCDRRIIVTSHDAFSRLAARYDLTTQGIAGFSPDAEPAPDRLAALASLVKDEGVTTIFTEALVAPAVAETLAREAGASVEVLDPIEGRPPTGDYLTVMSDNLTKLQAALGCR